jgi:hypothetical protein
MAFVVIPKSEPWLRFAMSFRNACRADGERGAIRGFPVFDVRMMRNPSEKFTSVILSRAISLLRNPHDHNTSTSALSRNVEAAQMAFL